MTVSPASEPCGATCWEAADGHAGIVRVPGGRLRGQEWQQLADMATELGDATLRVTARANILLRGLSSPEEFAQASQQAGFLPSPAHEHARNVVASPTSAEAADIARALDRLLCETPELATLPHRTLFGIDSGDGAALAARPHLAAVCESGGYRILGGAAEETVAEDEVSQRLLALARAGVSERLFPAPCARPPVGWLEEKGEVALGGGLPFGMMSAEVAGLLGVIGADVSLTPWSGLLIHGLAPEDADAVIRVLAPRGVVFDAASPWLNVSACVGTPACAFALSDTHRDAASFIASNPEHELPVYFAGCERRCGHPHTSHREFLATGDGEYEDTLVEVKGA